MDKIFVEEDKVYLEGETEECTHLDAGSTSFAIIKKIGVLIDAAKGFLANKIDALKIIEHKSIGTQFIIVGMRHYYEDDNQESKIVGIERFEDKDYYKFETQYPVYGGNVYVPIDDLKVGAEIYEKTDSGIESDGYTVVELIYAELNDVLPKDYAKSQSVATIAEKIDNLAAIFSGITQQDILNELNGASGYSLSEEGEV